MGFLQRAVSLIAVVSFITSLPTGAHARETTPFGDGPALSPNTDVIRLKSGSVLLGQLKFAERGLLTFDIAGIGDTTIKLSEIAELLATSADFQIDINGRQRTSGRITAAPVVGHFAISSLNGAFAIIDIVRLERINITLVERLNGYVGAGFSYSSGTDARQLSAREAASYVTARNRLFQYASVIMSDAGEKRLEIDRLETGLGDFFAFSDRWLGLQYFQYQEIPAVGVESRLTSITGAGMRIAHNRVMDLALLSGIAFQRETPAGESARGTETELPLIVDWELGIPRYETTLSAVAILYQGLSETGRQRLDFRLNLDHELLNNFTIGLHYLYNYDTEPLHPSHEKSSTTATFQAGYRF